MTGGLKKVTDDMKSKNRADRSGAVPVAAVKRPSVAAVSAGPPRLELVNRKWMVENQVGNTGIVIEDTDPKQTVYIYGCSASTIQVRSSCHIP